MITTFFATTLAYASSFMASNTVTGTINKPTQGNAPDVAASGLVKDSLQKSTTGSEATSVTSPETANTVSDSIAKATDTSPSMTEIASTASDAITGTVSSTGVSENVFSWGGYFQAIGLMLLLLVALWLALHLIRRSGKLKFLPKATTFPRDALAIESQIPLAPKKSLVVVRFLNSHVLLGVTEQNITYLKEVSIHDDERKYKQEEPLCTMDNQRQSADDGAFKRALRDAKRNTNTKETLSTF